jgi:hypothetical protein
MSRSHLKLRMALLICATAAAQDYQRDAAVDKWLREEVIGGCDAMQPDPGRGIGTAFP